MKIYKLIYTGFSLCVIGFLFSTCTKIQDGFISPTMQYSPALLVVPKGQIVKSNALIPDGSSLPLNVKWVHIYDSTGKVVDDIFNKTYNVTVWSQSYNPLTDTNYATIIAKRKDVELQPITVRPESGVIEANSATLNIPSGAYTMDMQIDNAVGSQIIENAMQLQFVDVNPLQTAPESGTYSLSLLVANTAGGAGALGGGNNGVLFNGVNNPFVEFSVTRFADTPNVFILKVTDKNGVAFNPKAGEIAKRPNSGLNPVPPFLQNLQDYAPDTFTANDTTMSLVYPVVPFPISSLGNGYNMYYRIPTKYVHIDSTSAWVSNNEGNFYQGSSDPHYLGIYNDDEFDYAVRIPLRIQVPGSYELNIKLLNATHR
jgi:hypothetical protein